MTGRFAPLTFQRQTEAPAETPRQGWTAPWLAVRFAPDPPRICKRATGRVAAQE